MSKFQANVVGITLMILLYDTIGDLGRYAIFAGIILAAAFLLTLVEGWGKRERRPE